MHRPMGFKYHLQVFKERGGSAAKKFVLALRPYYKRKRNCKGEGLKIKIKIQCQDNVKN